MKPMLVLLLALAAPALQEKNAEDQLKDALAKAKESKLKVFLTFGSPG